MSTDTVKMTNQAGCCRVMTDASLATNLGNKHGDVPKYHDGSALVFKSVTGLMKVDIDRATNASVD